MAEIARPILPLYLYRYRPLGPAVDIIEREINAIKAPYIWCSDFDSLNDPMEGFYRASSRLKDNPDYDVIVRNIANNKTNVGISSLSETKENELMWTHYAGHYSGICIEYYAQRLVQALPSNALLVRLAYGDQPPLVTGKDTREMDEAARKILSQKKFNWAYEREWRILGRIGKLPIGSDDTIRRVYLGSRISFAARDAILNQFKGATFEIYEMEVFGYKHEWKRVLPARKTKGRKEQA